MYEEDFNDCIHMEVCNMCDIDPNDCGYYEPKRKTCKNVYDENAYDSCINGFKCSECGDIVEDYEHYQIKGAFNFCPCCGAKVIEG